MHAPYNFSVGEILCRPQTCRGLPLRKFTKLGLIQIKNQPVLMVYLIIPQKIHHKIYKKARVFVLGIFQLSFRQHSTKPTTETHKTQAQDHAWNLQSVPLCNETNDAKDKMVLAILHI